MLYWTVSHKDEDPEIHAEYIGLYVNTMSIMEILQCTDGYFISYL